MQIDFKHELPEEEARARLEALADYLHNRHGIRVAWVDGKAKFAGKYMVVKIEGELSMAPGMIHFRGQDPGILWRRRALRYLEGKLARYLDPKVSLEELPRGAS
jgi:hypothetical protein